MELPTPKKTKKKFYNKFIYKVSLDLPGATALRYYSIDQLLKLDVEKYANDQYPYKYNNLKDFEKVKLTWIKLEQILSSVKKQEWMKRLEGNILDFYTNNLDLYNNLCNEFKEIVIVRFQPKKGFEKRLLDSNKLIFVDKIPHDRYHYKVFLNPHKIKSKQEKLSIIEWFKNQVPNITFTESIQRWILQTDQNYDRRYIYVNNEQTLLMLKLRAPMLMGDVYNYIKSDK